MQKLLLFFLLLQIAIFSASGTEPQATSNEYRQLYNDMQLSGIVNYNAFEQAMTGYNQIDSRKKNILTIIDFTKPSTEERLYVLDIENRKLLFKSHVSHGKNSGENYATSFSNKKGSNQSSLGFFLTEDTYQGKNGYSLVLHGLEEGINDLAKQRAVVVHGAAYANPSFIASNRRLGRSFGCPALPEALAKPIINTIKDGSVVFIYANDKNYSGKSHFLNKSS